METFHEILHEKNKYLNGFSPIPSEVFSSYFLCIVTFDYDKIPGFRNDSGRYNGRRLGSTYNYFTLYSADGVKILACRN